jgi:hypothetical protein
MDARPIVPDSAHGAEASVMIGGSGVNGLPMHSSPFAWLASGP